MDMLQCTKLQVAIVKMVFDLPDTAGSFSFLRKFKTIVDEANASSNNIFNVLSIALDCKIGQINYELAKEQLEKKQLLEHNAWLDAAVSKSQKGE